MQATTVRREPAHRRNRRHHGPRPVSKGRRDRGWSGSWGCGADGRRSNRDRDVGGVGHVDQEGPRRREDDPRPDTGSGVAARGPARRKICRRGATRHS
eukprot:3546982-Prymnesium_polylepis.1